MTQTDAEKSASLRQKGNDYYKEGKFEEAIACYETATELNPADPSPLSNLSAVFYEHGDYASAISAADRAIGLETDDTKKQKLFLRKAKSLLLARNHQEAREALTEVSSGKEITELLKCIEAAEKNDAAAPDLEAMHTRLIMDLPRYKAQIRPAQEYFTFGHDSPESLYSTALAKTGRDKITIMLAALIRAEEGMGRTETGKQFHFTIVDHKPAVIARSLVILLLLDELSVPETDVNRQSQKRIGMCLYYMYLAPIMPPAIYNILQHKIREAIEVLENRKTAPEILDVPQVYRASVIGVLREWQDEVQDAFPASHVRPKVVESLRRAKIQQEINIGPTHEDDELKPPEGCEKQSAFYHHTGVLILSSDGAGHSDEIPTAYRNFDVEKPGQLNMEFLKDVDTKWKTNVTFFDMDWERGRARVPLEEMLAHNPFHLGIALESIGFAMPGNSGLYSHLSMFFIGAADALNHLKGRLRIEACVGDVTCVLEQIRYGVVGHRQQDSTIQGTLDQSAIASQDEKSPVRIEEYPQMYDRIHLSNIPDYIGGSLATLMYALPLVHTGDASYVTTACLRNPPRFKSHAHFDNEYITLSKAKDLMVTFGASMEDIDEIGETNPFILTEYVKWHRDVLSRHTGFRMPREQFETWLARLFFKLAIPKDRTPRNFTLIYSPLNLTAFLRVCGHLRNLGYPAHWITGILDEICSGTLTTKARPPRSEPLKIAEVNASRPVLAQSTKPFAAEMKTLMSLWQCALPFGYLTPVAPINDIHQYTIQFEDVDDTIPEVPTFVLVLFSARFMTPDAPSLRPFLLDDEMGDKTEKGKRIKENIHIVSTWSWDRPSKTGTFWFRRDIMDGIRGHRDWAIGIYRTGVWTHQAMPQPAKEIKDGGPFWKEGGAP